MFIIAHILSIAPPIESKNFIALEYETDNHSVIIYVTILRNSYKQKFPFCEGKKVLTQNLNIIDFI